jgi:hypothetical protein
MVTLFFKWWLVPALGFGMFLNTGNKTKTFREKEINLHPIHISTVEIEHNAADKNLEITCKIFWDDFETVLTKVNSRSKRVDLTNEKGLADNNKLVPAYITSHLSLIVDGKPVALNFVGFEKEDAVIFSYLEVTGISAVKKISITNNLMHDMFDDQVEIIHVVVNGNRKSTKLEYPEKNVEFSF